METNHGKLLGMYDELSMFLAQVNVCTISDSQQVSTFLQLYGADQWIRLSKVMFVVVACLLPLSQLYYSRSPLASMQHLSIN